MPRLRQGAVLLLLSVATICSHAWEVRSLDTNSDDSPRLGEDAGTQKNGIMLMEKIKLGPDTGSPSPLKEKHERFLTMLSTARDNYCAETPGDPVFCQLLKGLRRKYLKALETKSTDGYQKYVLQLNSRYCTGPKKNLQSRRCTIFPTFLEELPDVKNAMLHGVVGGAVVNPSAREAYERQREHYSGHLTNMASQFCDGDGTKDSVLCKQIHMLQADFKGATTTSANALYMENLERVHKDYCERPIDFLTDQCKMFAKLLKVPAVMQVLHATPKIQVAVDKLDTVHHKYFAQLSKVESDACSDTSDPFCEMVVGMQQSFAESLKQGSDGKQLLTYMQHIVEDECGKASESKRCATTKQLLSEIPQSANVPPPSSPNALDKLTASVNKSQPAEPLDSNTAKLHATHANESASATSKTTKLHAEPLDSNTTKLHATHANKSASATSKTTKLHKTIAPKQVPTPSSNKGSTPNSNKDLAATKMQVAQYSELVKAAYRLEHDSTANEDVPIVKLFEDGVESCDMTAYTDHLTEKHKELCIHADSSSANKTETTVVSSTKRCQMFQKLKDDLPHIVCAKVSTAAPTDPVLKHMKIATSKAEYKLGMLHMFNLSPAQEAYKASLGDIQNNYCVIEKSPFCEQATALSNMFASALYMQYSVPYERHLEELRQSLCKKPADKQTKHCRLLETLSKTMVRVSHMGPTATERLLELQKDYQKHIKLVHKHVCAEDETSIMCQVCRGLESEYRKSLEAKTNLRYEHYLTKMEKDFCANADQKQENSEICKNFVDLRHDMPISMLTLETLPDKHLEFLDTVADIWRTLCSGTGDTSLFCEIARGMERVYIHSLNAENNSDFDFYLSRVEKNFCVNPSPQNLKGCKLLPVLGSGVPPAFLAEGVFRQIDSTNAVSTIASSQIRQHKQLQRDRVEYLHSLQDVFNHYCKLQDEEHPEYFCMLVQGLVKNYVYAVDKSKENWEFKHYLAHMKQDFCLRGIEDGYEKRCEFIPMLENGLPLSENSERHLMHEQNQFLKAIQDIVHHFCYSSMTPSVFCQLTHGLVRHYVDSLDNHSPIKFTEYLDIMEAHFCESESGSTSKKCKIFPVLRKGFPGSGLGEREAINQAAHEIGKAKAELRAARKIRKIAQQAVKKNSSKDSLGLLEKATHRELQAEKKLQTAQMKEVHRLAEKAGAPSTAVVAHAMMRARVLENLAKKAEQAAEDAKATSRKRVDEAKAQQEETSRALATATAAVKKNTSPENVKAVETAMEADRAAKKRVDSVSKEDADDVKLAEKQASEAADQFVAAKRHAAKLQEEHKKLFAQFTIRSAQKDAAQADEISEFAQARAKQAAQKLWWARVYAKENPTPENERAVLEASQIAERDAHIVEATAIRAKHEDDYAESLSMETQHGFELDQDKTEVIQMTVKRAKAEESEAQNVAAEKAAHASGPVAKEMVTEAKNKEQAVCAKATAGLKAVQTAKIELDVAAARVKASQSDETLETVQEAHKRYTVAVEAHEKEVSACDNARRFTIQIETSANAKGEKGKASAAEVADAAEQAAQASAAVEEAKAEEKQAINSHLANLNKRYAAAVDEEEVASAAAEQAKATVKRLTDMVANHPSEANIASLKKAMIGQKAALMKWRAADERVKAEFDTQKTAIINAVKHTTSPTLKEKLMKRLNEHKLAYVSSLELKLSAARTEYSAAQAKADQSKTQAARTDLRFAEEKIEALKSKLKDAASDAATDIQDGVGKHESVQSLKAALAAANKKKDQIKKLAEIDPSNDNLSAFQAEVREVNQLQTELMVAIKQQENMGKGAAAGSSNDINEDDLGQSNVAASLLSYYCTTNKYQNMCKFYKGFEESGWKNKEGKVSKQLLSKVAEARNDIKNIKRHLVDADAAARDHPSAETAQHATAIRKQLELARESNGQAEKAVHDFMEQQTQMNADIPGVGQDSGDSEKNAAITKQIGKLVSFYCQHKEYKTLCTFYTELSKNHHS